MFFTALFVALMLGNLTIADRIAPKFRTAGPEDELVQHYREAVGPHAGKVRLIVSVIFALFAGIGTRSQWNNWLLFIHASKFPQSDPQFHKNIGFYVFQLPFINFLLNWLFVALIITLVVTVDLPLPERWHPDPVAGPTGDTAGQGPHLGPARCSGPGKGGRLLVRAVWPGAVHQACRGRSHLHRRSMPICPPRTC